MSALETEVAAYLEAHRDERDAYGHALVVRNGKGRTRKVTVGSGTIPVSAPRVNDRRTDQDGERRRLIGFLLPVLQLPPGRERPHYVRCPVLVHEFTDDTLGVSFQGRLLARYSRQGTLLDAPAAKGTAA